MPRLFTQGHITAHKSRMQIKEKYSTFPIEYRLFLGYTIYLAF
jgi:hypothetical protein